MVHRCQDIRRQDRPVGGARPDIGHGPNIRNLNVGLGATETFTQTGKEPDRNTHTLPLIARFSALRKGVIGIE
jgi:hypothetical protein